MTHFVKANPYLIAEIGMHHNNDGVLARELIAAAAEAGAHAVKFQAYRADWLAAKDSAPYWDVKQGPQAQSQWEAFKASEAMPIEEYYFLAAYAKEKGVDFLITAFDEWLVDELDPLVPIWKIASGDITHEALIRHIASKGKPILLSTGASTQKEIATAIAWAGGMSANLALLHCVLAYPTRAADANLDAISTMRLVWPEWIIGWSDHVVDDSVVPLAVALGARIIEKHFSLDRRQVGGDHYHSWTPQLLRKDIEQIRVLQEILGDGLKIPRQCESAARRLARRALHEVNGEQRMLRPAF